MTKSWILLQHSHWRLVSWTPISSRWSCSGGAMSVQLTEVQSKALCDVLKVGTKFSLSKDQMDFGATSSDIPAYFSILITILMSMRTFHPIPPEYQKSCPNKERGPAQTKKGVPALKPTWSKNPNDLQFHFYEDCARPLHVSAKQGPPFPRLKSVLMIRT